MPRTNHPVKTFCPFCKIHFTKHDNQLCGMRWTWISGYDWAPVDIINSILKDLYSQEITETREFTLYSPDQVRKTLDVHLAQLIARIKQLENQNER